MASKAQFDQRFETGNLDYFGIYMHIASNSHFDCLCSLQTALKVTSDLGVELCDLKYPVIHVHIALILVASEAMAAFKRPRRLHLTSKLNSVTPITHVSMSLWLPKASMS